MMPENSEANRMNANSYLDESGFGDGTFAYDDDYSEMYIPATPSVLVRTAYGNDDDSAQDKISVNSSFMDYSYSNNFEEESTIATGGAAGGAASHTKYGRIADAASYAGFNSTTADIDIDLESSSELRPPPLNVADIMLSGDDELEDSRRERRTFIPAWVANASNSIKFVIVLATAMLLASLVLVSITASVSGAARNNDVSGNNSQSNSAGLVTNAPTPALAVVTITNNPTPRYPFDSPLGVGVTNEPTSVPITAPPVTNEPTGKPVTTKPTTSPVTNEPTEAPTTLAPVTNEPTGKPVTNEPTASPVTNEPTEAPTTLAPVTNDPTTEPTASPVTNEPTASPVTNEPTAAPATLAPVTNEPTVLASSYPTSTVVPTLVPTSTASLSPSIAASFLPSSSPSVTPSATANEASFYAISDNSHNPELLLELGELPEEHGEWLIHLGNWGKKNSTKCFEDNYEKVAEMYVSSSVPVFFVPGMNEWNNCPDYDASQAMWRKLFADYEKNWDMSWKSRGYEVKRQRNREENFAFAFKDAVYIGLNMVAGQIHDQSEWDLRLDDNFKWVNDNVEENWDSKLIVMFGSSGVIPKNDRFFDSLAERAEEWAADGRELQFLYVKENSNKLRLSQGAKNGRMSNLSVLNIESNTWPPTKISLDTNRYTMKFDDQEWFGGVEVDPIDNRD